MTTLTAGSSGFARKVLFANVAFSAISALAMLVGAKPLAAFLGLGGPLPLLIVGAGLIPFGLMVFMAAREEPVSAEKVTQIAIADALWVVGSYVLIFGPWVGLTAQGKWAVGIVAEIVALFAILEYVALRRMRKNN